jgi:hypothetical protein
MSEEGRNPENVMPHYQHPYASDIQSRKTFSTARHMLAGPSYISICEVETESSIPRFRSVSPFSP